MDDSASTTVSLTKGWRLFRSDAGTAANPDDIDWSDAVTEARVPGTVASTLLDSLDLTPDVDYDTDDWWYQCDFDGSESRRSMLVFEGLATIADVWLNGELILESRNMFRAHRVDVSDRLAARNTITIAFRSVSEDLKVKRPRPRWKTNLVANQQLRWVRTTLLGRIPGWTPPIAPVGPWRDIRLEQYKTLYPVELKVMPSVRNSRPIVTVRARLDCIDPEIPVSAASLTVHGEKHTLSVTTIGDRIAIDGEFDAGEPSLWSPQSPSLHPYSLTLQIDGNNVELKMGTLGFRSTDVDRSDGRLCFQLNGRDIFCRGACWTTNDIVSLSGDEQGLRDCLALFRSTGGNMIRVGGTMVYESDAFYDICDEFGIMVWQDFMFANMDYPSTDGDFLDDARREIEEQVQRLSSHPCVVAFCGNSEVEQQSAMFGMTADLWRNDLFYTVIPEVLESNCPGSPYFPSSPCEGALPFHNATGPSHYFGIGAYKQPLASITNARIKFTSECLAFSNMPADRTMIEHYQTAAPPVHHPRWKAGVPRDSAAGWDFEDIRDHYVRELYGIDPIELRYANKERYIAISQVVTGEVIEYVFNYWRDERSECSGGLIWQLRDIVPGAGWGFIDSDSRAKPLYYFLKRCWGDVNLAIVDRGLDGLGLSVCNETESALQASIDIKLLQHSTTVIADTKQPIDVMPREVVEISVDEVLGRFFDVTYRYRFGAPKHDVVVATLLDESGIEMQTRSYFPDGHDIRTLNSANVDITCREENGKTHVTISSATFLQHVKLYSRTHDFDDNFFHLSPTTAKTIIARPVVATDRPMRGVLSALNLSNPIAFS